MDTVHLGTGISVDSADYQSTLTPPFLHINPYNHSAWQSDHLLLQQNPYYTAHLQHSTGSQVPRALLKAVLGPAGD